MRRRFFFLAAVVVTGCDHTPPFSGGAPPPLGPRGSGNPLRLTYNPGTELRPTWLPDGNGFLYSWQRVDRPDRDHCLARMAAAGGTVLQQICDRGLRSDDSITTFESGAMAPGGALAYVRAGTPLVPLTLAPRTLELRLGTLKAPDGVPIKAFPYTAPSGLVHQGLEWLQWLTPARLVFLAERVTYEAPCNGCPLDTVRTGLEVVVLEPATGLLGLIPGTDAATSVAAVGGDTLYYTLPNDGQVWRRVVSTGAVAVAHDFGLGQRVRDVTVAGGRLVAILGRGTLWLTDLAGGPASELPRSGLTFFRRPALSPDGRHLVVEGYPFQQIPAGGETLDTVVSRVGDLWLFNLP